MSWITVIWSMAAAASITLAGLQFLVWLYSREARASLLFAISALAVAVMAILELKLMRAQSPSEYGETLRWMHVSVAVVVITIVWFFKSFLLAGRNWLAWSITVLRLLVLIPNFLIYPNATFAEIHTLHYVEFWGETFAVPVGEENPWRWLIHLSMLLFLIYVFDATVSAWKQRQHRRALVFGSAVAIAIMLSATISGLMVRGVLPGPFITLIFLIIVVAMAFELSMDLLRARKLAQDLDHSQRRMNLAAKAANLGLWEWDIPRDEVWVSEVSRKRFGVNASLSMRFNDYMQLIHPDDRETVQQAVSRTLEHGEDIQVEFRMTNTSGDVHWLSANGQLERDKYDKPKRLRGVTIDITERKQAEAELQRHRRDLAHVARVSTLSQLSSSLAHEINQPLGAILRNTEAAELLLQQTPPDLDEIKAIFVDIRNDNQRAVSVIERMRSLLKRRELQYELLSVPEIIEQVMNLLRTEIQTHHVSIDVELPDELSKVRGDRVHLQQVLINLILNSLDSLNDIDEVQRRISIRVTHAEDNMLEVAVIDNGAGISAEQVPHLFEPFYTTKTKGTGIGLVISKTIIDMHGGKITAENNPDAGATVRFTLPIA